MPGNAVKQDKLLELERTRYFRRIGEIAERERVEKEKLRANLASRGLSHSGVQGRALRKLKTDTLWSHAEARILIRRELATLAPELASKERIAELQREISGSLDAQASRPRLPDEGAPSQEDLATLGIMIPNETAKIR